MSTYVVAEGCKVAGVPAGEPITADQIAAKGGDVDQLLKLGAITNTPKPKAAKAEPTEEQ